MKFEWDEDKNTKNKEKHKISFETAAHVFNGSYYIEKLGMSFLMKTLSIKKIQTGGILT